MVAVAYLLLAVALSALGVIGVAIYFRQSKSMHSSIDDFERRQQALAPEPDNGRPPYA